MKTITGVEIPEGKKGIVYLCKYDYDTYDLKVIAYMLFDSPMEALNAYANIKNPESQIAYETKNYSFKEQLESLHNMMNNLEWRKQLADCL